MTLDLISFKGWLSLAGARDDSLKEPGFCDDSSSTRKFVGGCGASISQHPLEQECSGPNLTFVLPAFGLFIWRITHDHS